MLEAADTRVTRTALARLLGGVLLGLAGAAAALVVSAFFASSPAAAQGSGQDVQIVNFDFRAKEISVPAGSTITWTNTANRPHTATDRGGTFDTGPLLPGRKGSVTLEVPGRYFYFCKINPRQMNGVIEVTGDTTNVAAVRVQTVDPENLAATSGGLRFEPAQLTVSVGTKIQVANVGGLRHTLSLDDGSLATPVIPPGPEQGRFAGTTAEITVTKAGTFPFRCDIHPNVMKGVLTVVAAGASAPPTSAPPETVATSPPPRTVAPTTAPPTTAPPTTAPPTTAPPTTTAASPTTTAATAVTTAAAPATVDIVDFAFSTELLSVAPGAQITFNNTGVAPHTATFDDVAGLDTGTIEPGSSKSLTAPTQPGTYSYRCDIHPARMTAVLQVEAAAGASATETIPPATQPPSTAPPTTGAAAGAGAAAASAEVTIVDFAFEPSTLTVAPGAQITFTNTGVAPHTATVLDGKGFDTGTIDAGGSATATAPTEPGSYPFRCEIHPARMTATLVVAGEGAATETTASTATTETTAAAAETTAAPSETAVAPATTAPSGGGGGGASGAVTLLAIVTGIAALGLGGLGLASFLKKRRRSDAGGGSGES